MGPAGSADLVPGQPTQLTATPRDAGGAALTGRSVTWSSSNNAIAEVDANGLVTGRGPGTATITATSEGRNGTASISVRNGGWVLPAGTRFTDGAVTVDVPAGAVTTGTAVTVTPLPGAPAHPRLVSGSAFTIGPATVTFGAPVTLTLSWTEGQLPAGTVASRLQVHRHDGTSWIPLPDGVVDVTARAASGRLSALGPIALIDPSSDPEPEPAPGAQLISAGESHTCFLDAASAAWCWGDATFGKLGTGPSPGRDLETAPVPVIGNHAFVSVSANKAVPVGADFDSFSCGLTTEGKAYCWGSNYFGQLGTSLPMDYAEPTEVAGNHSFTVVSAGGAHACGIATDGRAWCWGRNSDGQLGNGSTTNARTPVRVSGDHTFTTISAGIGHTCGVATTGAVLCWGSNVSGRLGNGTITGSSTPVSVLGDQVFVSISAGSAFTCGLTTNGAAWCWGSNSLGQLGRGVEGDASVPVPVAGGLTFASLSAGDWHVCAVATGGAAYCWGLNSAAGELGNEQSHALHSRTTPTAVVGGYSFTTISAGHRFNCGVTTTGTAVCWGSNDTGQLGTGVAGPPIHSPVPVEGGHGFVTLSVGGDPGHACGVTTAGTLQCWGAGSEGQLGNGAIPIARYVPSRVAGGHTFTGLSAGFRHTCGVTTVGEAWCWGGAVVVGDGGDAATVVPVRVAGGHHFTSVTAGMDHGCGLTDAGAVWCWGFNNRGQLGIGSMVLRSDTPAQVVGGHAFTRISAGPLHTCGITTAGTTLCWGAGTNGRLGYGATTDRNAPVEVGGGHSFVSISAGGMHTCALTAGGAAWCWGGDAAGQLGHGQSAGSFTPVPVAGGHIFTTISAGGSETDLFTGQTCALTTAGAAWCWGFGALGAGTILDSNVPVAVAGGHAFIAISAGRNDWVSLDDPGPHACAMTASRETWCWGVGYRGRLGNGFVLDHPTPVRVTLP